MNRKLVNSKLNKYRERGKGTYTFCQVGCDCNIAVNLLEKCENLQSKIDKANEIIKDWHQEYNGLMETNNIYIPEDKPSLFDLRDILKEE